MAGHIESRGENKWRLVYESGRVNGKRIRHKKMFEGSEKQAQKALALFVAEVEGMVTADPNKITVAQFAERWLKDYGEEHLKPKTIHDYKQMLRLRVLPALGSLKMSQVKPLHLIAFFKQLQQSKARNRSGDALSPRTVHYYYRFLHSMFSKAVQWQVIKDNPLNHVDKPKVPRQEAKFYDEEQSRELLKAILRESPKYQAIIALGINTGLRRGEILGLEWSDINWETNQISVNKTSQYISDMGGTITGTPKTYTSIRNVSVSPSVMQILKRLKSTQNREQLKLGTMWHESDRLFTTWNGSPMHPDTISSYFKKFIDKNDLPPLKFHGLRHTNITLLLSKGFSLTDVAHHAGHANAHVTDAIYGHSTKNAQMSMGQALEFLFENKKEQAQ